MRTKTTKLYALRAEPPAVMTADDYRACRFVTTPRSRPGWPAAPTVVFRCAKEPCAVQRVTVELIREEGAAGPLLCPACGGPLVRLHYADYEMHVEVPAEGDE